MKTQLKEFAPVIQPARLDSESAARHLGFQPHDIPILIRGGSVETIGTSASECGQILCPGNAGTIETRNSMA